MATKKVKKFGRGGDILTGIGAALVGKALYDKYKGGDDIKSDGRSSGLIRRDTQPDDSKPEPVSVYKPKEPSAEEKRALAASQGRPESVDIDKEAQVGVIKKEPAPVKDKRKPAGALKTKTTTTPTTSFFGMQGSDKGGSKTAPAVSDHQKSLSKKITTPGDPNAEGSTAKGRSKDPIQGTIDSRSKSTVRSDKDKMRERALEVQRQREEAEKSRYKKGGAVKSASSRADGIAQRGKTRGKVY